MQLFAQGVTKEDIERAEESLKLANRGSVSDASGLTAGDVMRGMRGGSGDFSEDKENLPHDSDTDASMTSQSQRTKKLMSSASMSATDIDRKEVRLQTNPICQPPIECHSVQLTHFFAINNN